MPARQTLPAWTPFSKVALMVTDALFTCYARYVTRLLVASGSPVFLSMFMHAPSSHANPGRNPACTQGATCHAADISWMFPQSPRVQELTTLSYTPAERLLASSYSAALRRFAHGWDWPWRAYGRRDISLAWDTAFPNTIKRYHEDHCDMFESIGFERIWTVPAPSVPTSGDIGDRLARATAPLVV